MPVSEENLDTAGIPFILLTAKTNHDAIVARSVPKELMIT